MKKVIFFVVAIFIVLPAAAAADSIDTLWIIEENTGSPETMVELEDPDLSPNQVIEVYIEAKGLTAKWGEGSAYYTYTYYSELGKKIWSSREYTTQKRTRDDTWTFSHVQRITIPNDIPNGSYRLAFELTDYHTNEVYQGNVHFTVGKGAETDNSGEPREANEKSGQSSSAEEGDYRTTIGEIELKLVSVEKSDNRLTFTLKGINRGETKDELRLYSYNTRIISAEGEVFVFSEHGGEGTLVSGIDFPPEVPMQASFYFKRPVPARVSHISYLEIPFYSKEDKIIWHEIPIPWPTQD